MFLADKCLQSRIHGIYLVLVSLRKKITQVISLEMYLTVVLEM